MERARSIAIPKESKVVSNNKSANVHRKIEIVGELGSNGGNLNAPSAVLARLDTSKEPILILVDTGATIELIRKSAVPDYLLKTLKKANVTITGVNGGTLPNLGVVKILVSFHPNCKVLTDFIVIEDKNAGFSSQALIGRNYLRSNRFYFSNENKAITFNGVPIPLVNHDEFINNNSARKSSELINRQSARIFASRQTVLPPRSSAILQGFIRGKPEPTNLLFLPVFKENVHIAESVHLLENAKRTFVHVTNTSNHPIVINKSSKLGDFVPFVSDHIDKIFPKESHCLTNNIETKQPWAEGVPEEVKDKLGKMIAEFDDIFAKENSFLKPTNMGKASILTEGGPIFTKNFPIAEKLRESLMNEIHRLLKLGVIKEQSNKTPWNSPFLLVRKGEGSSTKFRGVLDFRNINKITKSIHYDSPSIERLLEKIGGNSYYSITDLKMAFLQVELNEADSEKTAFRIGNQCYSYTRLAMGTKNSSPIFQQIIDSAISKYSIKPERRIAYCDDLLTFTPEKSPEIHLQDIRETFQILRQASLSISLDKCQFFKKEIKFLGFLVSKEKVEPDPLKCRILADLPKPETAKMLISFLASANFFRRHIPRFSETTAPLYELANKKSKNDFVWTKQAEKAFNEIKQKLLNATQLSYPDLTKNAKPFILHTDASLNSIAGVLSQSQKVNGKWIDVPISFCSRMLSTSEKKKSIYNLELQAIIYSIKKFSHLLTNNHFIVRCDQKPLSFLLTTQKLNPALSRAVEFLSEFSFTIEYCEGKDNIADIFSRIDVNDGKITYSPEAQPKEKSATFEQFLKEWENFKQFKAREQNNVPGKINHTILATNPAQITNRIKPFATLSNKLNQFSKSEILEKQKLMTLYDQVKKVPKSFKNYTFSQDSLLYKFHKNNYLLVIPPPLQLKIFKAFHENPQSFHHGVSRTWLAMKNVITFPKMKQFIEKEIANCHICQTTKTSRHKIKVPMGLFKVPEEPWTHLHFDIAGPILTPSIACDYKYALLITDRLSKYTVIKKLQRNDSESVFEALVSVFLEYGFPTTLTCDQASQHTSKQFVDALKNFNVSLNFSQAYQQNQNGLVERQISIFKQTLRAMLAEHPDFKWTDVIKFVQSSMNGAVNRATNLTPNKIFFGRNVKTANEANFSLIPTYFETNDNFQTRLASLRELRNKTKKKLETYSRDMIIAHNEQINKPSVNIPVGSTVYRANNAPNNPQKGPLYSQKFRGPFIVKSKKGSDVELLDPSTGKTFNSHLSQLKWPRQATNPIGNFVPEADKEEVSKPGPSHSYNLRNKNK